jgi:hypothetical protein
MCSMRRIGQVASVCAIAATLLSAPVRAQPSAPTAPDLIDGLQAGWVLDRMLVFPHNPTLTNPGGCSLLTNGYIVNETDPGRKTFYALMLGALLNGRQVQFVIQGCFEDRPRIVSVSIH